MNEIESRLARSLVDAVQSERATRNRLNEVKETFTTEVVERWDEMIAAWEQDADSPNPYVDLDERGSFALHTGSEISINERCRDNGQRLPS